MTDDRPLRFLGGSRREALGGGLELRVLSAWELLQAQREGCELAGQEQEKGLCVNAAIVSKALRRGESPAFADGKSVLSRMSAEQIEELMERYIRLCEKDDLPQQEQALDALEEKAFERLKWKVLRTMHVLPSHPSAREMTTGDYLYCAMQLMLDEKEYLDALCPECRAQAEKKRCPCCGAEETGQNPQFDEARFEELKNG